MKTAKFILGAMALVVVSMVAAPAANAEETKGAEKTAVLTNGLWDNWFVNGAIGFNYGKDNGSTTGLALEGNVGKWFTPTIGAQAGLNGIAGFAPDGGKYIYAHVDALWNASNFFGGYKADRLWDFVPYFHTGLVYDPSTVGKELASGFGLNNIIRPFKNSDNWLNRVNVTLNVRGTVYAGVSHIGGLLSTTAGLSYNLGRTDWTTASEYHNPADQDKIAAVEAAAAALTAANAALVADKAKLEKEKVVLENKNVELVETVKIATETASGLQNIAPASFFFEIGKTELSAKELKHLDFYLANVLPNVKGGKATVVTGTADSNTGYAKRNEYLSKKRAEYMINLLKERGIATENIVVKNAVVKAANGQAQFDRAVVVSFE